MEHRNQLLYLLFLFEGIARKQMVLCSALPAYRNARSAHKQTHTAPVRLQPTSLISARTLSSTKLRENRRFPEVVGVVKMQ